MPTFFLICSVLWLLSGLVFTNEKDITSSSAHAKTYPAHLEQEGITIAAVPYLNPDEVKKTFDKILINHKIVPVKLIISNDRAEAIRIEGSRIRLIDPEGNQYRPLEVKEMLQRFSRRKLTFPRPPPDPLPRGGPISGKKLRDLEIQLKSKELGSRLVPPRTTDYGFLFFLLSGGSISKSRIYIPGVFNLKGERGMFFEIEFAVK